MFIGMCTDLYIREYARRVYRPVDGHVDRPVDGTLTDLSMAMLIHTKVVCLPWCSFVLKGMALTDSRAYLIMAQIVKALTDSRASIAMA